MAIAEQHAVTFAAGLAIGGYKPVVAIYSTFLQRRPGDSRCRHPEAAGAVRYRPRGYCRRRWANSPGAFDISFLRCIPDMVIMTPSDENECRQMLYTGYHYNDGPSAVRLSARLRYRRGV